MPRIAIFVNDPQKAWEAEVERNTRRNVEVSRAPASRRAAVEQRIRTYFQHAVPMRQGGYQHDVVETGTDCPEGMPNCRNCGDPAFAESCRAQGHCPDCGTKHGIAPDAVLAASGYVLGEPLAEPEPDPEARG